MLILYEPVQDDDVPLAPLHLDQVEERVDHQGDHWHKEEPAIERFLFQVPILMSVLKKASAGHEREQYMDELPPAVPQLFVMQCAKYGYHVHHTEKCDLGRKHAMAGIIALRPPAATDH
jgi:hypothetical protein